MLKKLKFFVSMPFTAILLLVMIVAMAMATFIESAQGTNTAWAQIYDAWWFELVFVLVLINLVGNVIRFKLYKRQKLSVFMFHVAFILIIVGGGITRYFSEDGMMRIREGGMSGSIVSSASYMDVELQEGDVLVSGEKKVRLSTPTPKKIRWKGVINGKQVKIKSVEYMQNAAVQLVEGPGGQPCLQMVVLAGGQRQLTLMSGEETEISGLSMSFNVENSNSSLKLYSALSMASIQESMESNRVFAISDHPVSMMIMGSEKSQQFMPGDTIPMEAGKLLTARNVRFAVQKYMPSAKMQYVKASPGMQGSGIDVTKLEIDLDGMKGVLFVQGMKGLVGEYHSLKMGETTISCAYGSHKQNIPFVLRLEDFKIDRYPGSHSPSSFESEVVLIDIEKDIKEDRRIYMNNVLKHRGYRFYQSSYDPDEKGTVLSVKKDFLGTAVTYAGYLFMTLGMLLALLLKGTRFRAFAVSTGQKSKKVVGMILILLMSTVTLFAQEYPVPTKAQAKEFGHLWVQGKEGRLKPMNTLSTEVLRKVVKKSEFNGMSADQIILGMILYPEQWKDVPLFEVKNAELQNMLGYKGTEVSFNDFVNNGQYLLSEAVNAAYNKRVQDRSDFDKEVMKLDEKINVFYMVQSGDMLKIFPDKEDSEQKWRSVAELFKDHAEGDTLAQVFLLYTKSLKEGNVELENEIIDFIGRFQEANSTLEMPDSKKKLEILYNKVLLFERLPHFYMLLGILLLVLNVFAIFKSSKMIRTSIRTGVILLLVAFMLHTIAFGIRWYVSGHAPLSNGYESMIFVSWVSLLAGLLFAKRTGFAIAMTALLSGFALLVAHLSWMNPDITNLVPVLKSPWLTIHVTVIMAGYGFLGMSMLLGLLNLVFYAVLNLKNKNSLLSVISQLTKVNQLALIIGLYALTIGTFLGGVWANESWGRYWGWDPKETWALISVLVYTFISHQHRFPGLKGDFAFAMASMWGFSSILMTYFGVNYFLGGIHSYAGGAAFQVPAWVFIAVISLFILSMVSYTRSVKYQTETKEEL